MNKYTDLSHEIAIETLSEIAKIRGNSYNLPIFAVANQIAIQFHLSPLGRNSLLNVLRDAADCIHDQHIDGLTKWWQVVDDGADLGFMANDNLDNLFISTVYTLTHNPETATRQNKIRRLRYRGH